MLLALSVKFTNLNDVTERFTHIKGYMLLALSFKFTNLNDVTERFTHIK